VTLAAVRDPVKTPVAMVGAKASGAMAILLYGEELSLKIERERGNGSGLRIEIWMVMIGRLLTVASSSSSSSCLSAIDLLPAVARLPEKSLRQIFLIYLQYNVLHLLHSHPHMLAHLAVRDAQEGGRAGRRLVMRGVYCVDMDLWRWRAYVLI